ncbi:MAG: hypothetical protein A2921_03305 [Candidatus Magasanikbacteria bacterium RIFCSPLOWO2_01_FULL_43_20b]|uniref:Uncharacterized protein n=1 Tax=Candidatus Magasanikbacteria bacterium RIFCSPLOWO2_12_FULL_43_12 TaxID=1798692 RepID=A0A1F6MQZ3_9BACT|nr:MAG: hypothetical protein A3C74_01985 [Candidatus Magasanikbacteria bacterium RIFCSPHIGHO2_02_FULL_44_13]OGH73448.1 MAG: hypothetical protein A2921_03305 [Candidatus Magasanikbacteria bacterium RIFCSPLOWO2_01_FULL_43_20b]OGH74076.1 MAG: hypothetical protein A3G00_02150 [Candidatus Magasanikbacteria bacterium RIFCSPLOWO2_12_FULL_43_12]
MLFWKKDKTHKAETPPENILKIPEEFYGAKDPVVHYAKQAAIVQKTAVNGKSTDRFSSVAAGASKFGFLHNKKMIYILVGAVFLLVVGLISWYYISPALKQTPAPAVAVPEPKPKLEEPVVETPPEEIVLEEEVATLTEEEIKTSPSLSGQTLQFPMILLANSADIDSDSMTDLEEEVFGTDSGTWDTDGDGYYDGQELFNLYNPAGVAPMKIIDSGLAKEYVNPIWQYRVYYPAQWQVGEVDDEKKAVLFSAITGDYVEVFVSPKDAAETFEDWFAREATGQSYADLQPFTNRFQEAGWKRSDDLTAYFITDSAVLVLVYNPGVTDSVPFRHVMQMMSQGFRPSKTSVIVPEQTILP